MKQVLAELCLTIIHHVGDLGDSVGQPPLAVAAVPARDHQVDVH
jgi:hypothetical protein